MDAIGSQLTDLGIAVEAIPDRVVADFVSNRAGVDFADCAFQDVASCDVPEFVDLLNLHTHTVEVAHDQSLQMFDLMSLTQKSSQSGILCEGPEVDMLVDILVDGTAEQCIGHMSSFLQDHESPVDQNFLDRRQKLSKHQRKQSAKARAQASASAGLTGVADKSSYAVQGFPNSSVGLRGIDGKTQHIRHNETTGIKQR
jgi:hypothetical protein